MFYVAEKRRSVNVHAIPRPRSSTTIILENLVRRHRAEATCSQKVQFINIQYPLYYTVHVKWKPNDNNIVVNERRVIRIGSSMSRIANACTGGRWQYGTIVVEIRNRRISRRQHVVPGAVRRVFRGPKHPRAERTDASRTAASRRRPTTPD